MKKICLIIVLTMFSISVYAQCNDSRLDLAVKMNDSSPVEGAGAILIAQVGSYDSCDTQMLHKLKNILKAKTDEKSVYVHSKDGGSNNSNTVLALCKASLNQVEIELMKR